ncbi:protein DOWNSTREAM OF FLC [Ziziphus jujuba]|uniref:Protein DOWNSTREAM OF FLC n=1 Tax=Ziziphus jujuba TaxID=326968 RepID=A0A6P4A8T7_ZIZJJ|nr:protein DOWNSTREAM OF FLC [Ziziphus jujuba]
MSMAMARLFLLSALCVLLPALVLGQFQIQGRIYCDNCRFGFETEITTYIQGATVRLECVNRTNLQVMYSAETQTDSTGTYNFDVKEDHQDQMCNCLLGKSPVANCNKADRGRKIASAVLTAYNGVVNRFHKVNSMGFLINEALPHCKQLHNKYFASE